MGLFNIIKAAFMYKNEVKEIEKAYPKFFNFLKDYGYVCMADSNIWIEDKFLTSRSINSNCNLTYNYGKVVRFMLVYRKNADLVAVCRQFKTATGLTLFMPSEMEQFQYIVIYGWRNYSGYNKNYNASLVFGFGDEWCLPFFRDGRMHINSSFSTGGMKTYIEYGITKEMIIKDYNSFIKKVVEDLINSIKWHHIDTIKYGKEGWYIDKMKGKYENKIPSLYYKEEEISIPNTLKKKKDLSKSFTTVQIWSLLDFAREHGKMQVGSFINKETQETWKSCIFTLNDVKTFVAFSSKLGELTPKEIAERKNQLKVAKWIKEDKEGYILYE